MEMKNVPFSSNVKARGYDLATRKLHIQYANGTTYEYDDVEPELVAEFDACKSKGSFPRKRLKDKTYRKL